MLEKDKGRAGRGVREKAEGCSGYQGRNDEDGSGTSRVEAKEASRELELERFACC